jgi:AraC-like DNA-binding protein
MKIAIKNMDCPANMLFVRMEFEKLGIPYKSLEMGSAELYFTLEEDLRIKLSKALAFYGLEVVYNDKSIIVHDVKSAIKQYGNSPEIELKINLQKYISEKLKYSFSRLNKIFTEETGISIEGYFQSQKIERAIILLVHYNLTLNEITYQLNYKDVEELISNFKNITGMTPDRYKQLRTKQNNFVKRTGQRVEIQ